VEGLDNDLTEKAGKAVPVPQADPLRTPRLSAEQLALLRRYGEERPTVAGQVLFREGDRGYDFIVILSGSVTVVDHQAGVTRELAAGGPGDFVVELNILTGERLFTTAVVKEPGSVLVVPVDRLHEVIAQDQVLADLILQTTFRRRQWLVQERAGLRIVGSRSSPDARRLREFAVRNRLPHVWVDLDTDPMAGAMLSHHGLGAEGTPIVVMRGGEVLRNPSNTELARAAGFGRGVAPGQTFPPTNPALNRRRGQVSRPLALPMGQRPGTRAGQRDGRAMAISSQLTGQETVKRWSQFASMADRQEAPRARGQARQISRGHQGRRRSPRALAPPLSPLAPVAGSLAGV
jgi:CRP-like cAMP-binding protein